MGFIRFLSTGNHERLARGFEHQYRHDRIGVRLHLLFGLCWCFFLGWPITWIEFAAAPLYFYGLLRLTNTWRIALVFLTRPVVLLAVSLALWSLITLSWSPDAHTGWNDLSKFRFFIAAAMLWSVMDSRRLLIAALACGFLAGNAAQFADMLAPHLGIPWLDWDRPIDRNSGWWKPAVAGSLLVGALGLHLPAAIMGHGRERWIGVACAAVTLVGLLATGTRGAWIAAGALVVIVLFIGVIHAVQRARAARRPSAVSVDVTRGPPTKRAWPARVGIAALVVVIIAVAASFAWKPLATGVKRRITIAREELRFAWEKNNYSSFTGQRLLMWDLAAEAVVTHPISGVGVGGFRAWAEQRRSEEPRPESPVARERPFPHAHNALLHEAATTGLPGAALLLLVTFFAIRGAFDREQLGPDGLGSYAAGPGFAIIGLVLVSAFDTLQVNAATVALGLTLFVMCLLPPPRTPSWVRAAQATA